MEDDGIISPTRFYVYVEMKDILLRCWLIGLH